MAVKKRAVDTTKNSNVRCEHCKYWQSWAWIRLDEKCNRCAMCGKHKEVKKDYNRCSDFEWRKELLDKNE